MTWVRETVEAHESYAETTGVHGDYAVGRAYEVVYVNAETRERVIDAYYVECLRPDEEPVEYVVSDSTTVDRWVDEYGDYETVDIVYGDGHPLIFTELDRAEDMARRMAAVDWSDTMNYSPEEVAR
jgi:hypothetical protein